MTQYKLNKPKQLNTINTS